MPENSAGTPTPPVAEAHPVRTEHFGHERVDEYDWLRDKDAPEVIAHLEAENAYTEARTEHLADLRAQVFDEIKARTRQTDLSVPTRRGEYWYYSRSFEGREYGASCRVPIGAADEWTPPQPLADAEPDTPALPGEEVMLDLNELAEGHDFFSLGGTSVSPDATLMAYATDVVGDERYTVRVKDLASRELLPDELTDVMGGATWHPDGKQLFYVTVDEAWRPYRVWRHELGAPQADDELVFEELDQKFMVGVGRSRSQRFMMIVAGSKTTTEYHLLDTEADASDWRCVAPRETGVEYSLDHAVLGGTDVLLALHNANGPDFELGHLPIDSAGVRAVDAVPLIEHTSGVRLEDVDAFATHLVVHQRSEGLARLRILSLHADAASPSEAIADDRLIEFGGTDDTPATVSSGSCPMFDQPTVRVAHTSLVHPASVHDYTVATGESVLLKQTPVLGGFDASDYVEQRLWATARDGARIPMSLVMRADARGASGTDPIPVHLYGYGSYEISIDPGFSIPRLSVLDRGAAFVIAHVRGGGEMGRAWYEQGRLEHKTNTFTDFVTCAEHLVAEGWTTPDLVVAEGGSAGGLLMGAVANLAPAAFGGIVANVPFVDTLTSMLDDTLPLTIGEYEEWGNPAGDEETYLRIRDYAPYENVEDLPYPPILAETSLNDTRVLYVEPAKWVARLRERAPQADVLLKCEMAAGHGGVSGRYRAWQDRAFSLAWILDRLGLA